MTQHNFSNSYSGTGLYPLLLLFFCCTFFLPEKTNAQDKCGTVQYESLLKKERPHKEEKEAFESWINARIAKNKTKGMHKTASLAEEQVFIIPVVVHVVHNGENIGVGANISKSRILSQIEILNQDFRRQNTDTTNTPIDFRSVASDTKITFVLAKRDPEGLATDGIVRKKGSRSAYSISNNWDLKAASYWPAEDYLNIWVAPLANNLLGFAQFPQSGTAPGLEDASANRLTDGVVIDYNYFGNNNAITPASKGRTTTHEVGHFLGLRHIWGDGGCDEDDYCEDTPGSDSPNYGCPSGPVVSCGNNDMFQNYMDYTDDNCMNLFTIDQSERIRIVMENSPRRKSLRSSKAGLEPIVFSNDLGIKRIISPIEISCEKTTSPEIMVRNYGDNLINSFKILYLANNDTIDSLYQSINLLPMDSIKVSFPTFALSDTTNFTFRFIISATNDGIDENPDNNTKTISLNLPESTLLPYGESFEGDSIVGAISNPDERYTWNVTNAPNLVSENHALRLSCFNYESDLGERDFFLTPIFDLLNYQSAKLTFEVAYAQYNRSSNDGLQVLLSSDCGATYPIESLLYKAYGADLATAEIRSEEFVPDGRLEWKTITIDLSDYVGLSHLRLSFAGINDYGNNIYLDKIKIEAEKVIIPDLKIIAANLPPVICNQSFTPSIEVVNQGKVPVSSFITSIISAGKKEVKLPYNGEELAPYDTALILLPEIEPFYGPNAFEVSIEKPNGVTDLTPENNFRNLQFVVDTTSEELPLREQFSSEAEGLNWFIYNPDQSTTWTVVEPPSTDGNKALYINSYEYAALNEKDWLISPLLNFNNKDFINLTFSISYAYNFNYKERLQVLVSTDCGLTYSSVAYDVSGEDLSSTYSSSPWEAGEKESWQKISLSLDDYIGNESVRVAFVTNNGYGNNLYLDDIEFFISQEPKNPLPPGLFYAYPNPVEDELPLTFNLAEKETVAIELYDMRGKILYKNEFPNTLNQTYSINVSSLPAAVYIIRLKGATFNDTKRLLIKK